MDRTLLNNEQNAAANTTYQGTINRPHQHVFLANSFAENKDYNIQVPCAFPVREVRVRANFSLTSDIQDSWYVTSNMPCFAEGGGVCAGLNTNCAYDSKNENWTYSGGFGNTELVYVLRQPMMLQGTWQVKISPVSIATLIFEADIMLDFEFFG